MAGFQDMWKQYLRILAVVELVAATAATAFVTAGVETGLLDVQTFIAGVLSGEVLLPLPMAF